MWIFSKEEQENFDDFQEEVYIFEDGRLVKQEGEKDVEDIKQGNE